jgi:Ca2+-binding RTX toxin-like protein
MASTPTNGDDVLNGTAGNDIIKALGGNDTLKGLGGNDSLNGGTGIDTMYGGNGEDVYYVDHVGDRAIEVAANTHSTGGRDLVRSTVSYTIGSYIEDLYLTGAGDINATGNTMANRLTGNSGNNRLDGRTGADSMAGGDGNDIYVVDNVGDRAVETNADRATGGIDTVQSSVSFKLGANVEKLTLTGTQDIDGTGNGSANTITGNAYDNTLIGGGGNDILTGGRGGDEIEGGAGSDRIVYKSALDSTGIDFDTITGFNFEEDKIDVTGAPPVFGGDVIQGGRLSKATFDADLSAAVGKFLSAGEAVVFVASQGDFAGKTFLVVDGNGEAGYQKGGDYVVRVEDSPVPTSTDFFI